MQIKPIKLRSCSLKLGELHQLKDFEHINPEFECIDTAGNEFTAKMRLHISEPLDKLVIADPRAFADQGVAANSVGSHLLKRRTSFSDKNATGRSSGAAETDVQFYEIPAKEIKRALLNGYDFEAEVASASKIGARGIAFTCHDPNIIGGGNTILFRLVNWLAHLGVRVSVYSCGSLPTWTRVEARFFCFENYEQMFAAIDEDVVVLYSMWHIEPMLRTKPKGKRVYHLRQIYEPYHYGDDFQSTMAAKPAITLIESLPIGTVCISPHLQDFYKRFNGQESLLLTNGIDLRVFYPAAQVRSSATFKRVLSVGDPEHYVKGGQVLAEALQILGQRRKDLVIEWAVVSGTRRKVQRVQNQLPDNVVLKHLAGLRPAQMRKQYQSADVFVNAVLYEGFGLPTIEAMACGVPVVQCDNRGLDFIVENERDCLVVPPADAAALAQAIERLLNDQKTCQKLRTAGFQTAARYSLLRQFECFVAVFSKLLGERFPRETVTEISDRLAEDPKTTRDAAAATGSGVREQRHRPLVSVVIPTYNQAEYLRQALDSLLKQTYEHWEAVVMNDGSTDDTQAVMAEYAAKDGRIRPFTKANGGITSALNAGLEQARGEFFCWLSSDDLFYPTKLELQVKAYQELDDLYALVYGNYDILDGDAGVLNEQPVRPPHMAGAEFSEALKFDFIDGCTVMIRMQVMREVGGFNPYYRHSQDMELWIRIASRGYRFWMVKQKLTVRRVHFAQSSTVNMIHCRYDAACMINYYLEHFHLLELYRYFNFHSAEGVARFVRHFVGRMTETEANINNPLLQEKFWEWFLHGLEALPTRNQNVVLRNCLVEMLRQRHATTKMSFYIARCLSAVRSERRFIPAAIDFSVRDRDIREDNREADLFTDALFQYGTDLLINSTLTLFGQELYFHNTNKVVDSPWKLGHSALRYLAQFPNRYRDLLRPYAAIKDVPVTEAQAVALFCRLRFPADAETLLRSYHVKTETAESVHEADVAISAKQSELGPELARICAQGPSTTIFYYWYALTLAAAGNYLAAIQETSKVAQVGHPGLDSRMVRRVGDWTAETGVSQHARFLFAGLGTLAPELSGCRELISAGLQSLQQMLPVPPEFVLARYDSDLPEANVTDCHVTPLLNGHFRLDTKCLDEKGRTFVSTGVLPYLKEFEPTRCTDVGRNKDYLLTAASLWKLWAADYNFSAASSLVFRRIFKEGRTPSVAFTLPASSVMSGGGAVACRFANWLCQLGVEVVIYSADEIPDWTDLLPRFRQIADERERCKAISEDIIIAFSVLELPGLLQHHVRPKRIFHLAQVIEDFHYHGHSFASLMQPKGIFRILHALPVGRLAVSRHIHDYLQEHYQQKSLLVENGVDHHIFHPRRKPTISDRLVVLTVGSPERLLKGVAEVKSALTIFAQQNPGFQCQLIVASGQDIALEKRLAAPTDMTLTYLTNLSPAEMAGLYQRVDVYVNAAWYEGFGLPTIEAMASGVPVVQSDNKGLDGVVKDGHDCLLVPPANPQAIAIALGKLVGHPELRQKLIANGLGTAAEFSQLRQYDSFVTAFEEMLMCRFNAAKVRQLRTVLAQGDSRQHVTVASKELRPLLSIVVPAFDQPDLLDATLTSLLAQTYHNFEALVLYDGATSAATTLIERLASFDRRIRPLLVSNHNLPEALNAGLNHCRGEWILFLPAGCLFSKERLSAFYLATEYEPAEKFFYTQLYLRDPSTGTLKEAVPELHRNHPAKGEQLPTLFQHAFMSLASVMLHHSVFDANGGFNNQLAVAPELDLWLRLHSKLSACFLHSEMGTVVKVQDLDDAVMSEDGIGDYASALHEFFATNEMAHILNAQELTPDERRDFVAGIARAMQDPESLIHLTRQTDSLSAWVSAFTRELANRKWQPLLDLYRSELEKGRASALAGEQGDRGQQKHTSIIILVHNQRAVTQKCLASLARHTPGPHEIIIVDNGSDAETRDYLKNYARRRKHVVLIRNRVNKGFAAGNNQALAVAQGDYLLLMNNDTVVTRNWLRGMISVFYRYPDVGIVGPVSNYVSGPQQIKAADYRNLKEMQQFADNWRRTHLGEVRFTPRLVGFFLLLRREVVCAVGGLDERFGSGNFEDDDFCFRAARAGFKSGIAYDIFIHHYGNRTFKGMGLDYDDHIKQNWRIFKEKWHLPPDLPYGAPYTISTQGTDDVATYLPLVAQTKELHKREMLAEMKIRNDCLRQLYFVAERLLRQGQTEKALSVFNEALEVEPNEFEILVRVGELSLKTGKKAAAIAALQRALRLRPNDEQLRTKLARVSGDAGPNSLQIQRWFTRGKDLITSGEVVAGLNTLSKILDIDPQHRPTLELMSDIYRQVGKETEAQQITMRSGSQAAKPKHEPAK